MNTFTIELSDDTSATWTVSEDATMNKLDKVVAEIEKVLGIPIP